MRILFLSDAASYHTQRWVNYFVNSGHQCYLISLEKGFETKAEEFFVPPKTFPDFLKYPLSLPPIRKIFKKISPDLVNAHFIPNYGLIGVLLKAHPLVISTWGSDVLISPGKSFLHKLRTEYILRNADLVTADAEVSAQAVCRLGVVKEKVVVSPMGVERGLLGSQKKEEKPYVQILSNRKLEPLYDVATLLKSITLVIEPISKEARFIIVGEGSCKDHLVDLARKLKVEKYTEFKGIVTRNELLEYYRDSDVYVSTSLSDSTSVSLLEAMSFGLIPLVTDIPGNREWIQDQKNGFLFPPSDSEALAEKIIHVINEFRHVERLKKENEAIIRERALWEENMKNVEREFVKLARGGRNT